METKKILKMNYKLGKNFLVAPAKNGWVLMRCGSYRVVMDSKNDTEEDLDKFIKEHKEYNVLGVVRQFALVTNSFVLALCFANLFIKSKELTFLNVGALMILIPLLLLTSYIGATNHDVFQKVLEEDATYYGKLMSESLEEENKKKSTRSKKVKGSSEIQK